ncbi:TetR/AcrR family transcriptional regulator [Mycolicibacterium sp. CBM1]
MPGKAARSAKEPKPTQRRRRSTDRNRRDPERTRKAILHAAAGEFGEHGYENARVARIAAAAGVNHQLITYHFGGKQGLYDALTEDWLDGSARILGGPQPIADVTREFVQWAHSDESWTRTLAREGLEGGFPIGDSRVGRLIEMVEKNRLRQKQGEWREDLDVGALTLAIFAAACAPVTLPAFARAFVGLDPASQEFWDYYAEQLVRLTSALGPRPIDESQT